MSSSRKVRHLITECLKGCLDVGCPTTSFRLWRRFVVHPTSPFHSVKSRLPRQPLPFPIRTTSARRHKQHPAARTAEGRAYTCGTVASVVSFKRYSGPTAATCLIANHIVIPPALQAGHNIQRPETWLFLRTAPIPGTVPFLT